MLTIPKKYLTNEKNERVAVQLDVKVFEKIEETLENFGLMKFISENKGDKPLSISEAKAYYKSLRKK